ncbi:hypothetical protein DFH01_00250 [Falsiroseomonas bella]|uniref:Uncharacterized protein n=1 Tax=Falsiroseomonas bella TaxID=2184016 RepID=A0A317FJG5_9PROT|nr:hypothetical protein [Falsiroseomonas bella]PWS37788.1 hypothetical protein DFH01_00250 [Falsiroseomonas bella]
MKDEHSARPPLWQAVRLIHAALDDRETCDRDRAIAQAMLGAMETARLPWIADAAADLAETVADPTADADLRQHAWRALAEEHHAQRPIRRALARGAAPWLVVGGTAA